jgi:uncharacterized protein (TIGR03086 family)
MSDAARGAHAALDQLTEIADKVRDDDLDKQTACTDWTVADLLDHLLVSTDNFKRQAEGGEADWTASAPDVEDRAAELRSRADALHSAWESSEEAAKAASFAGPEFAVHGWDLATAIGVPSDDLDQSVAEDALGVMQQGLTEDNRAPVFGPEQEAPEGANAADRLAAFAGRSVGG